MNFRSIKIVSFLWLALLCGCQPRKVFTAKDTNIIPKPSEMQFKEGTFLFNKNTRFFVENEEQKAIANQLAEKFEMASGFRPQVFIGEDANNNSVCFLTDSGQPEEGYVLEIKEDYIQITASEPAGFFYAVQTLRQLLPVEIESKSRVNNIDWLVPAIKITDGPRFKWRGFMQDVSRHFFQKEYIMELIDYLSLHKINTFHWHLTDDQGWRIEIKQYPKLTEVGAWRKDPDMKLRNGYSEDDKKGNAIYGGFYTQEDIKEIVAFAKSRYVTIVPEIEMPGHSTAALAAYPHLGCTGGPYEVQTSAGIKKEIFCAGKDETIVFLQNVLDEVLDLFPSKYIHIGGDEVKKDTWEQCEVCQKRIHKEELDDENELQSWFITRMDKYLAEKGRSLIGWDEILEGGLAPEATVMSWRGFEGGIKAAGQGHDVVMAPIEDCYFNFYQGPTNQEPPAWGRYLPISKVYEFEPVHESIQNDAVRRVLGGQACLWTSVVSDEELSMYMTFPRIAALAETLWTPKELKDWADFSGRVTNFFKRYDEIGINYAKSIYSVFPKYEMSVENKNISLVLTNELPTYDIRFVLGNENLHSNSNKYSGPITISETTVVKAAIFENDLAMGKTFIDTIKFHKAFGKKVKYLQACSNRFTGQGEYNLINAIRGTKDFRDGLWQGWINNDMEVVIDLEKEQLVQKVTLGTFEQQNARIFFPLAVEVSTSTDGKSYKKQGGVKRSYRPNLYLSVKDFEIKFDPATVKFVKVKATNLGISPDGRSSSLFVDEIIVE